MTFHVSHTNKMIGELKQMYQDQINHLREKIKEQEEEIQKLENLITILTTEKEYDC